MIHPTLIEAIHTKSQRLYPLMNERMRWQRTQHAAAPPPEGPAARRRAV